MVINKINLSYDHDASIHIIAKEIMIYPIPYLHNVIGFLKKV